MVLKFLLSILGLLESVKGHSTYVPQEACVNMFPRGHGVDAQTNESPYIISVDSTRYTRGQSIEIFVNVTGAHGIEFYEGILLQVRHAVNCDHPDVNKQVGRFELEPGEDFLNLMTCTNPGDTIAHKAHAHIYNRTFTWIAPSDLTGPVFIRATIARRQETFWTNVVSDYIIDPTNTRLTPTTCVGAGTIPQISGILVLLITVFIALF